MADHSRLRAGIAAITTPREAVDAMIAAGAVFAVHQRSDCLSISFTYAVAAGGDIERCREILAVAKARPPAFLQAFKAAVQAAVANREVV